MQRVRVPRTFCKSKSWTDSSNRWPPMLPSSFGTTMRSSDSQRRSEFPGSFGTPSMYFLGDGLVLVPVAVRSVFLAVVTPVAYIHLVLWYRRVSVIDRRMGVILLTFVTTFRQTLLLRTHPPTTLACTYRTYVRQNSTLVMPEPGPQRQQQQQQHPTIEVPPGFTLHTENTTHILLPSDNGAFLNPVQEFNRDLSVACIRVWSEEWNRAKEARWKVAQEKKAKRPEKRSKGVHGGPCVADGTALTSTVADPKCTEGLAEVKEKEVFRDRTFLPLGHLPTGRTVPCAEVRVVGGVIGYGAQVNPLRQGNPSGKVSSVFCLAAAESLTFPL